MTADPLVSVIVPAKDQEAHLSDCLTSLVDQLPDRDALEVIVVDDGSRDATSDIAATFGPRLPGLRVLRNDAGSEVVFTLFRRDGVTDAEFAEDAAAIEADLETLRAVMEN